MTGAFGRGQTNSPPLAIGQPGYCLQGAGLVKRAQVASMYVMRSAQGELGAWRLLGQPPQMRET